MTTPVWIFTGPEIGEKKTAIKKIRQTLAAQHKSMDVHRVYAYETPARAVVELLQSGSLFSTARLVILKNAELIKKKDEVEILLSWISTPHAAADAFLILESDSASITKKLEASVPASQRKIFWELFENKKQEWVRNFFTKHNLRITNDGIDQILSLVENNTDALKMTCSQIVLFFSEGDTVTDASVETLLAHNKEETPFSLFDALTRSKIDTALVILQKLLLSKDSSAVQILAGLRYCFRRLGDWHEAHDGQQPSDFDLKRLGFTAARARAQYSRAARLWNRTQTREILALLHRTDMEMRAGGNALHHLFIEKCIIDAARGFSTVPREGGGG